MVAPSMVLVGCLALCVVVLQLVVMATVLSHGKAHTVHGKPHRSTKAAASPKPMPPPDLTTLPPVDVVVVHTNLLDPYPPRLPSGHQLRMCLRAIKANLPWAKGKVHVVYRSLPADVERLLQISSPPAGFTFTELTTFLKGGGKHAVPDLQLAVRNLHRLPGIADLAIVLPSSLLAFSEVDPLQFLKPPAKATTGLRPGAAKWLPLTRRHETTASLQMAPVLVHMKVLEQAGRRIHGHSESEADVLPVFARLCDETRQCATSSHPVAATAALRAPTQQDRKPADIYVDWVRQLVIGKPVPQWLSLAPFWAADPLQAGKAVSIPASFLYNVLLPSHLPRPLPVETGAAILGDRSRSKMPRPRPHKSPKWPIKSRTEKDPEQHRGAPPPYVMPPGWKERQQQQQQQAPPVPGNTPRSWKKPAQKGQAPRFIKKLHRRSP